MRHRKAGIKLNRSASHRKAMFRNMVTSLLKYDRIQTTGAKAKELRRWADRLITLAKRGDLHARRQALAIVTEKEVVHKLFENAAERFGAISGGYTRIVKVGTRPGDAAPVAVVELVVPQSTKKKKAKAEAAPQKAAGDKKAAAEEKTEKTEDKKPKKRDKAKGAAAEKETKSRVKTKKTVDTKDQPKKAADAEQKKSAAKKTSKKKAAAGKAAKADKDKEDKDDTQTADSAKEKDEE
jgi:large subunit ribosomal protein L17